ncbi:head-tail adaptor [Klebsiella phage Kpn74]|uniref:Head-tail adaptor n=1 Tax=Klebsiella phage Kpn74 TaxID=3044026 RepID=A0AAT9V5H0_9CAUD|nr:head-tail adaptor [Klebsiella phage Kpn74]
MSLKPGDMNCRIAISYVQSGRGRWANRYRKSRLNREKRGQNGSWYRGGKSARWISSRWWKPACLRSIRVCWLILTGKSRRKIWFIPSGISTAKQTGSLSRGG